ncbi:GNAT family N-acetyltransferase [Cuneatibacter sp. NSJ-177]|uniref:GNAT family N-acetyltransferase n=1 Tax=Cuneatibacter sp. NSJ-177 TaxID=2931401 RepID=UPI001FD12622|nr:GNAT family protein [Cuneatibacter sp. NSJ-177]MCJ7836538.1 GNAT family N-acetyltransferase [Cuneatibacter sp. NSJ-177]
MNCTIRKWKLEDAETLSLLLNNENIMNNLRDGLPYPYTKKDAEEYIQAMLNADPDKTYAFAILCENQVAGSIGVFRQENIHNRTAEMGYYIGEPYWGKGLGTCAVSQICHTIFTKTNIIRIYAEPFAYNTASCRILEKNGFQFEGTLRQNAVKNGQILDMKMYSLIKMDWQAHKREKE